MKKYIITADELMTLMSRDLIKRGLVKNSPDVLLNYHVHLTPDNSKIDRVEVIETSHRETGDTHESKESIECSSPQACKEV